jgi:hypothetical protein
MKALVVYESMFGNSAQVAEAVARGLRDVQVVEVGKTSAAQIADLDLLVLGGPTHAFSMTRPSTRRDARTQGAPYGDDRRGIRELLDELPETFTVPVATFDTRVAKARKLPGSAAKAATKELRHHHHARVVAQESFYVDDTAGPLLAGEPDRAESWGAELTHTIAEG